jgi:hypothetical protein
MWVTGYRVSSNLDGFGWWRCGGQSRECLPPPGGVIRITPAVVDGRARRVFDDAIAVWLLHRHQSTGGFDQRKIGW